MSNDIKSRVNTPSSEGVEVFEFIIFVEEKRSKWIKIETFHLKTYTKLIWNATHLNNSYE